MAVKVLNQIPADAYAEFKRLCARQRTLCLEWIALLADAVDADQVWACYRELYTTRAKLDAIAAVPGIADYAVAQEGDPTYDIATEFGLLVSYVESAYSWIYAALPRDTSGYLLTHTTTVDGMLIPRLFAPTQTAPLVTRLQAIVDCMV